MGFLHGGGGGSHTPPSQRVERSSPSLCPHCGKDVNEPPRRRESAPADDNKKAIIQNYLDTLSRSGNLTKWEEEFVDSVTEQFERRGTLSDKQIGTLEKIYGEKC